MTAIEWVHRPGTKGEVWNPVTGCTKVSAGCKHCYAETIANRFWAKQYPRFAPTDADGHYVGDDRPRVFTDVVCHEDRLGIPLRWSKPRTVFVNSMSDLFHEAVPDEFIQNVFTVMAVAHKHTFVVLTKRPERMRAFFADLGLRQELIGIKAEYISGTDRYRHANNEPWRQSVHDLVPRWTLPLSNVWLGVSVEDQATADARIPLLLETPAAVRVVSAEPLLGAIDLRRRLPKPMFHCPRCGLEKMRSNCAKCGTFDNPITNEIIGIDWLIVGGESGPKARPCDVAWLGSLVQQAKAVGVPCFVKQLGTNPRGLPTNGATTNLEAAMASIGAFLRSHRGADPTEWAKDLRVREWPEVRR